jgi:hypothetical protein
MTGSLSPGFYIPQLGPIYLSHFSRSPKVVKEAIMTDINDLVQEFLRTSSDGAVEASLFAMRRLLGILQGCFDILEVCFLILFPFCDCRRLS